MDCFLSGCSGDTDCDMFGILPVHISYDMGGDSGFQYRSAAAGGIGAGSGF